MKKLVLANLVALSLAAISTATAAETVTITGEGACAKCILKIATKCQNAISMPREGSKRKDIILLEHNAVSKDFHDTICLKATRITVEGTLEEKDGEKILTPTKITEVK